MLKITALSVLQGVAEFLPISSSGHLVLGERLLGLQELGMRLDIFLHLGTLLSVGVFYFAILKRIIAQREWSYAAKIVLSAIPAGVVGMCFKDQLEALFDSPTAVGYALCFTGLILIGTKFLPKAEAPVSFFKAFLISVAQAIAILPGVSRSGMTIAAAKASGVKAEKAAEFSFLMSIPPIAGAALLEVVKSLKSASATPEVSWSMAIYGSLIAAVVGYFSLKLLLSSLKSDRFWYFGIYCIFAGGLTVCLS